MSVHTARTILITFLCLLASLVAIFCAGQIYPGGGPPDTTPPEITGTYPAPQALHFTDRRFAFEFSEHIDHASFEQSLFISPNLGELTFDWGGANVEVKFADSLRSNTTYVIAIGTDVEDRRNHNRMAKSFTLAFSTGDRIDSAAISGRVDDARPEGVMIFAYRLDGIDPDTLNPAHVKPDYLTQTGTDGTFLLPYLAPGRYRALAIRDQYKNLFYDPQIDDYGAPLVDITLDAPGDEQNGVQFRLTQEDTTLPFLSGARALDRSHVLLRFSELIDPASGQLGDISITDTLTNAPLGVFDLSFIGDSALSAQLVTAVQESARAYRVTVGGVRDGAGNIMAEETRSAVFTGEGTADTTKPAMEIGTLKRHTLLHRADSLEIFFTEAIRISAFEHGVTVTDSLGETVGGTYNWKSSAAVTFKPDTPWRFGQSYTFTVVLDSLEDKSGNSFRDSTVRIRLPLVNATALGSIAGRVTDEGHDTGNIHIHALPLGSSDTRVYRQVIAAPDSFTIAELPEGKYLLSAFRDADGNGTYTYGAVFPFNGSERFVSFRDTLKVRARWPLEGVMLRLK